LNSAAALPAAHEAEEPMSRPLSARVAAVVLLLLLGGCGDRSDGTLTGSVTVDGKPLKRGSVRLEPAGGQGTPAGGVVQNGRYEVRGLKPGKYNLHVEGEPESGPVSQEEVMRRSEAEHRAATANPVPPGAVGNGRDVEVTGGPQTHDVALTSPTPAKK
jgi:hypothetical protein